MDTGWSMQLGKIADAVLTMEKIEGFQTLQSHTIISAQCQIQYLHACYPFIEIRYTNNLKKPTRLDGMFKL